MRSLNMIEKAMTFKYILLTSQVVLVLEDAAEGKELTDSQWKILSEGSDLLKRIIEGAALVEGKEFKGGLTPTAEGLSIYGYALSTIKKLDLIKDIKGFTEFFVKLNGEIVKFIEQRKKDDIDISRLENFFHALGNSFRGDIQKEGYFKEKTFPFSRKDTINDYTCA